MWAAIYSIMTVIFVWSAFEIAKSAMNVFYHQPSIYMIVFLIAFVSQTADGLCIYYKRYMARHAVNLGSLIFYLVFILRYAVKNEDKFLKGMWYVGGKFTDLINSYYKVSLQIYGGQKRFAGLFIFTAVLFLTVIFHTIAVELERESFMALFPVVVLMCELGVGKGPDLAGMAALFAGVIICAAPAFKMRKKPGSILILGALCIAVIVVSAVCFEMPVDNIVKNKMKFLSVQKQFEADVKSFFTGGYDIESGTVSNEFPDYKNKEVMKVTVDGDLDSYVYLRGYYGDTYSNGSWKRQLDYSEIASDFSEDVPECIADQNKISLENNYGWFYQSIKRKYTIEYTGLNTEFVYAPYITDTDSLPDDVTIDNDYIIKKDRSLKELSLTATDYKMFSGGIGSSGFEFVPDYQIEQHSGLYDEYDVFVSANYLSVPSNIPTAGKIADMIKNAASYDDADSYLYMLNDSMDSYGMLGDSASVIRSKNEKRLAAAYAVQNYLDHYYKYSKELPASGGTDNIEYFLSTSKEGFCVHFASAGVMILRSMGVPARYACGYSVPKGSFSQNEDGSYVASVLDSRAHAWAEVYLDGYGWMPVEMTPGYYSAASSSRVYNADNDHDGQQSGSDNADPDSENTDENDHESDYDDSNSENPDSLEDGSTEDTSGGALNNGGTSGGTTEGVTEGAAGKNVQNTKWYNTKIFYTVMWIITVILFAGIIIFIIWYIRNRKKIMWQKHFEQHIKRHRYNKAAIMLNRKVYENVRGEKHGHGNLSKITDSQYAKILCEVYPDLDGEHYIDIMRKAVYSQEELSLEEWNFVYDFWMISTKRDQEIQQNIQKGK